MINVLLLEWLALLSAVSLTEAVLLVFFQTESAPELNINSWKGISKVITTKPTQ